MIGLKRGTVKLYEHDKEWEFEARKTIIRLREILGTAARDIQHVGSTAIPSIKAKPIIDIAVAVYDFNDILVLEPALRNEGFYFRTNNDMAGQKLWACGSYYEGTGDLQTHFIHVVIADSTEWMNYINFRDYLNKTPSAAKEYEDLKSTLAAKAPVDEGRELYLKGKHDFIVYTLRKALVNSYLGKNVTVKIDRTVGSAHPKHPDLFYPVNYGHIPGVIGGDGEALGVYVLGANEPLDEFTGRIIAIVHHENDAADKLVAAMHGISFNKAVIAEAVAFQEQNYKTRIEVFEND